MTLFKKMSETEMRIMKIIWNREELITAGELLEIVNSESDKELKIQTINTFLTRLTNKGLLKITKNGRVNYYGAQMSLREYKQNEAQSILNQMYKGSVKNFLSALYNKKVDEDDLHELEDWFSKK